MMQMPSQRARSCAVASGKRSMRAVTCLRTRIDSTGRCCGRWTPRQIWCGCKPCMHSTAQGLAHRVLMGPREATAERMNASLACSHTCIHVVSAVCTTNRQRLQQHDGWLARWLLGLL
jgi:hypothetical protein